MVVPVFDEAATLGAVVAAARRHAPVLVVDDGSRDGSAEVARRAGAEVIRHPRRLGKGQALRTGVAAARARGASHVLTLDGDGQHDPADLGTVLAAARAEGRAVVVGGRGRDAARLPPDRRNAMRLAGFFVNWVGDLAVRDSQSGFRAYPIRLFDEVAPRRGGFVFETEVLLEAAARGWRVVEVPVRAIPHARRRSRFRPLRDGAAIGVYLAHRVLARWGAEAVAAAREVRAVLGAERRRARHLALLDEAAPWSGSPAFGLVVLAAATRRAAARGAFWWRHPRLRRAGLAACATLAAPALVVLLALQALGGRWLPDVLSPLLDRLCPCEPAPGAADAARLAPVPVPAGRRP